MINDLSKILQTVSGANLAQLTIPKTHDINNIIFASSLSAQLQAVVKQSNKAIENSTILNLSSNLTKIAETIQKQHSNQIFSFQSISQKIQNIISQQTKFSQDISKITSALSPALDSIKTISSYNAFEIYKDAYNKYGGSFDPDNYTEKDIENVFNENKELLEEVNNVVLQAEKDGVLLDSVTNLIYTFLIKKIPNLKPKTFAIIVFIYLTVTQFYGLYSDYSTGKIINEKIIPIIENHSEQNDTIIKEQNKIKEITFENNKIIQEIRNNQDSTNIELNKLNTKTENVENKLDMLLKEMEKLSKNQDAIK